MREGLPINIFEQPGAMVITYKKDQTRLFQVIRAARFQAAVLEFETRVNRQCSLKFNH